MQHGFNFLLMVGEMFLNRIPFYPYLLGYVGIWTSAYGIWAFINFSSSGKWMYPVRSVEQLLQHCLTPVCNYVVQFMLLVRLLMSFTFDAVLGCIAAMGTICLFRALCHALGILRVCDSAASNQVLDPAVLAEQKAGAYGKNGVSAVSCHCNSSMARNDMIFLQVVGSWPQPPALKRFLVVSHCSAPI